MTKITPDMLIGAVVEEVDYKDECIHCVRLITSGGVGVELYANDCHDCENDDISMMVL